MNKRVLALDQITAILGAFAGLFVIVLSVAKGHYGVTLPAILFAASLVYLVFRKNLAKEISFSTSRLGINSKFSHIVYILSISAGIWILWSNLYNRPFLYFIAVLVAAGSVVFDIISVDSSKNRSIIIVLLKIIILTLSIYAGKYFEFYGIYGSDPWWHIVAIQQTTDLGHISGEYLSQSIYHSFPLFHILGSITQIITGLSAYAAVFMGVGIAQCLSCLFIFLIGKKIFDKKIGLLAALIIPLSAFTIQMSSAIIPMSLGFFFFLIVMYLLLYRDMGGIQNSLLILLISTALIFTHTIAALITLLTLVGFFIGSKIREQSAKASVDQKPVTMYLILLFGIAMILVWMQTQPNGQPFFDSILRIFSQSLDTGIQTIIAGPIQNGSTPYIIQNLDQAGYLIVLTLGIIGALICLHPQNRTMARMALVVTLAVLTGFSYGFQFLNLKSILPDRWFLFLNVPLSILAVKTLINLCASMKNILRSLTIIPVILVILFLSTTNSAANDDSPLVFNGSQRIGYTKSEITAASTLIKLAAGRPETDLYYGTIFPSLIDYYGVIVPNTPGYAAYSKILTGNEYIFIQRNYFLSNLEWNKLYVQRLLDTGSPGTKTEPENIEGYLKKQGISQNPLIYSNGNVIVYTFTKVK